jgi:phage-related protein
MRDTCPISWLKRARRDFEDFPQGAQIQMARALTILAEGQMPDIAKPLTGLGAGVMELALRYRGMPSGWFMRYKSATTFGWSTHSRRNRSRGSGPRNRKSI